MTDVQAMELGRRLLLISGWRPGMRSLNGYRFISVVASEILIVSMEGSGEITKFAGAQRVTSGPEGVHKAGPDDRLPEWPDAPDLRDPATKGAALEVVRERWGDPLATLALFAHDPPRWCVVNGKNNAQVFRHAATEPEALVAALEAAGGRS